METNQRIENIIFDLGNVIIDIKPALTAEKFIEYAPTQEEEIKNKLLNTDLFFAFEKGNITVRDFEKGICQLLNKQLTSTQIAAAWNALLLNISEERIKLLKKLKNKYRTFILSNTNQLHVTAIEERYPLKEWVEKVYYSCDMGKRKPDTDIYEQVLFENKLLPEATLFIDDNLDNVHTARALNIPSIQVIVGENSIIDFFDAESLEVKYPFEI